MSQVNRNLCSIASHDGAAMLDIHRGTITTLNETGAFVWQELGRGRTEDEIILALAQCTGEAAVTVADDVREFVTALSSQGLLPAKGDRP